MNIQEQHQALIIRRPEACNISGIPKSSWYDGVKKGLLPQSVSLGGRSVGWVASEVNAVLKARIRGDSEEEIKALVTELTNQRKDLV